MLVKAFQERKVKVFKIDEYNTSKVCHKHVQDVEELEDMTLEEKQEYFVSNPQSRKKFEITRSQLKRKLHELCKRSKRYEKKKEPSLERVGRVVKELAETKSELKALEERMAEEKLKEAEKTPILFWKLVQCGKCKQRWHRDVNAALNILSKAHHFLENGKFPSIFVKACKKKS